MHFGSIEYAALLLAAMSVTWIFREKQPIRVWGLLALSYFFFARWNLGHPLHLLHPEIYSVARLVMTSLGLLLFSSTIDYFVAHGISRESRPKRRKALLALSLCLNLGILSTFKYFDFFASVMMNLFDTNTRPFINLIAPIGISFYTFQTMSYVVDVYRGKVKPASRYADYLLYLAFFPQLVMGPIVRAHVLLPQIESRPLLNAEKGSQAIFRIGIGLVKKLIIADFLRAQIVDPVFSNPEMYSSLETLTAVYAYAFQIYADFSAYSDIAIGSAALLGVEIPENFLSPYRASSLREFWQRWHITLSSWLRDYLYIPLGGSRRTAWRTYVNLMVTMILGGLWHGPALTFVVWGTIHGGALVVTRIVERSQLLQPLPVALKRWGGVLLTFHIVTVAWIFFRSPSFDGAAKIFSSLALLDMGTANISWPVAAVLALAVATHFMPEKWMMRAQRGFHMLPAPVQAALFIGIIYVAKKIASTDVAPFIYLQF